METNEKREAIGGLRMLLAVYPDYALAHNDLGVLYYNEGEKDRALEHYEEAARLEPENATYQKNLADFCCVEIGDLEGALKIYLKVLEANPTDLETLLTIGDVCVSLGKNEDAKIFYNRVLEFEPWNMDAQGKLEAIENGQNSEVRGQGTEDARQRTEFGGQSPEVRDRASEIGDPWGRKPGAQSAEEAYSHVQDLVNEGQQAEAIQELEKIVEKSPDHALAHNDLGVLYYGQGEKQKALTHYEKAAGLEPENATFQKNLADFCCVEMGELQMGLKIYLKVLEDNPTDIEVLNTLGDICVSLEKSGDARVFYDRVLELEPWNMEALKKLETVSSKKRF
ncbi:MAG: tetratricopeptide repeat protein [Deltaproteobacteria bacterium]|nr:tetratricopeptide repeat protein [Deltaproteobacteria bacterium]